MPSCAVASCKNTSGNISGRNISMFRFPREAKLVKIWVLKCKRKDKFNTANAVVCSEHFENNQMTGVMQRELLGIPFKRTLLPGSIPTRNLPNLKNTSKLQNTLHNGRELRQHERVVRKRALEHLKELSSRKRPNLEAGIDDSTADHEIENHASLHPDMICSVESCRNHSSNRIHDEEESSRVIFHRFPRDANLKEQWIKFCKRPSNWKGLNGRICSDHFSPGDYDDKRTNILKKDVIPTRKSWSQANRELRVITPSKERMVCRKRQRRKRTPTKLVLPEKNNESSSELSLEENEETDKDACMHRSRINLYNEEKSNRYPNSSEQTDLQLDSTKCYKIVCTVLNPTSDGKVSVKKSKELEKGNEFDILKRKLDKGVILLKSDHLKQLNEEKKLRYTFESKCTKLQEELEKARKEIEENLMGEKVKRLELEKKNLQREVASLKFAVNREKNNAFQAMLKLKGKTQIIKTMENDIKISQHLKNPAAIIRGNIESLLKRVFTENQVNMLLLKQHVITWTNDEMDSFLKISQKISKRAYLFLVKDMSLPFPGASELESFSNKYYPGLPVFTNVTNDEQQGAVATITPVYAVPEQTDTATTSSSQYTVPCINDVAIVSTNCIGESEIVFVDTESDMASQIVVENT